MPFLPCLWQYRYVTRSHSVTQKFDVARNGLVSGKSEIDEPCFGISNMPEL